MYIAPGPSPVKLVGMRTSTAAAAAAAAGGGSKVQRAHSKRALIVYCKMLAFTCLVCLVSGVWCLCLLVYLYLFVCLFTSHRL